MMRCFLIALLALAVITGPAQAAEIDLNWAVDLAVPYMETALLSLLAAGVGWLLSRVGRWLGLEIDRERADTLHAAIERGVRHAMSLLRSELADRSKVDVESRIIAETAIYLEQLLPDALEHFGLTDEALDRLIRAHLGPDLLHWAGQRQPLTAPAEPVQGRPS